MVSSPNSSLSRSSCRTGIRTVFSWVSAAWGLDVESGLTSCHLMSLEITSLLTVWTSLEREVLVVGTATDSSVYSSEVETYWVTSFRTGVWGTVGKVVGTSISKAAVNSSSCQFSSTNKECSAAMSSWVGESMGTDAETEVLLKGTTTGPSKISSIRCSTSASSAVSEGIGMLVKKGVGSDVSMSKAAANSSSE